MQLTSIWHRDGLGRSTISAVKIARCRFDSYVLPLKCRRSLVSGTAINDCGIYNATAESAFGFASARESDATAVEVARRQPAGHVGAHEVASVGAYIATRLFGISARGTSSLALVSYGIHQYRGRAITGNPAATRVGIAARRCRRTYYGSAQPFLVEFAVAKSCRPCRAGNAPQPRSDLQACSGYHSEIVDIAAIVVRGRGHSEGFLSG
jgi:hypothetical protein